MYFIAAHFPTTAQATDSLKPEETFNERVAQAHGLVLRGHEEIDGLFGNPPMRGVLHIIVRDGANTLHAAGTDVLTELATTRTRYYKAVPSRAPSQGARPSEAKKLQEPGQNKQPQFDYGRPPEAAGTVPVTLRHPVFNDFIDSCYTADEPSEADNAFALELSFEMSKLYSNKRERQAAFIQTCEHHGLFFVPSQIETTSYPTDGDMRAGGFMYCIMELKWEAGASGAEPVLQGGLYYQAYFRHRDFSGKSPFPCLGLSIVGPSLTFFGMTFTEKPQLQILVQPLRFDYHFTDIIQRMVAARYLGALRKATQMLKNYYENEAPLFEHPTCGDPRYPCYFTYQPLDGSSPQSIVYTSFVEDDKLLWFGESEGVDVCIKFVRRYSKEAHQQCAQNGMAPRLLGFEALARGWWMVVMDRIDREYEALGPHHSADMLLHDSILAGLEGLHRAGYVHGDVRDTNVMVKSDGSAGFMLLDFDWSGKIGEVTYPMNVNKGLDLWRPEGAKDQSKILAAHDLEMMENMFHLDQ